jgi:hypothetical protein
VLYLQCRTPPTHHVERRKPGTSLFRSSPKRRAGLQRERLWAGPMGMTTKQGAREASGVLETFDFLNQLVVSWWIHRNINLFTYNLHFSECALWLHEMLNVIGDSQQLHSNCVAVIAQEGPHATIGVLSSNLRPVLLSPNSREDTYTPPATRAPSSSPRTWLLGV